MRKLILITLIFNAFNCMATDTLKDEAMTPLLGDQAWDEQKTLQELRAYTDHITSIAAFAGPPSERERRFAYALGMYESQSVFKGKFDLLLTCILELNADFSRLAINKKDEKHIKAFREKLAKLLKAKTPKNRKNQLKSRGNISYNSELIYRLRQLEHEKTVKNFYSLINFILQNFHK